MFADEILGDYESRYFGAGHKRTNYKVEGKFIESKAEVSQTDGWSEKDGCQMKPHLSTVDGIILAVMYVEKYIQESSVQIKLDNMLLYSFEIKAGSKPVEDLTNIALNIKKEEILEKEAHFEVSVEGMNVKLHFRNVEVKDLKAVFYETEKSDIKLHYFSEHLKNVKHNIGNIKFGESTISCVISKEEKDSVFYEGIGCLLSNSMSILEWLIIFSQMGQLLAYDIDLINRQESETLWMKNVKAEMDFPVVYKEPIVVSGGVVKSSLLNIKEKMWRVFEMAGTADDGNIRFEGKIAHVLPNKKKEVVYE